jgi:hypothetical protein
MPELTLTFPPTAENEVKDDSEAVPGRGVRIGTVYDIDKDAILENWAHL